MSFYEVTTDISYGAYAVAEHYGAMLLTDGNSGSRQRGGDEAD